MTSAGRISDGLASWRGWVIGLTGWRRALFAFGLGVLAVLALPPFDIVIALVPSLVGLFWLGQGAPTRRTAFTAGWWYGLGYFTAGLYWISNALLVDAADYGWLVPFAVLGLSAYFAVYPALTTLAVRWLGGPSVGGVLLFAAAWTFFEWVRGWALTGFPWNPIGSVWALSDAMLQPAAVIGVFGLGLFTVAAAAMPAALAAGGRPRRAAWAVALSLGVLAAGWAGGTWRLAESVPSTVPGVRLRLVQPNIPQKLKWVPELRLRHVEKQVALSRLPAKGAPPTDIIWSETAVPYFLAEQPGLRRMIASATPPGGLTITGTLRRTAEGVEPFRLWNSMMAIDSRGDVVGTYDKVHLVPFGEYVPLRGLLPFKKLTAGRTDFSPGRGLRTLKWPGLPPVGPLICYEIIFPGHVVDPGHRPGWLLNLTNDSWYGRSTGPYQHLVAARFRAVEEGLPVVRDAFTGISAVIDPYGRIVKSLGLDQEGIIDADLPKALAATPFARWGNVIPLILAAVFGLAGFAMCRRDNRYVS